MSEKRFEDDKVASDMYSYILRDDEKLYLSDVVDLLNSLSEENEQLRQEVAHWKHRVNSLLWILGQFDKGKVRELLKEIEDE